MFKCFVISFLLLFTTANEAFAESSDSNEIKIAGATDNVPAEISGGLAPFYSLKGQVNKTPISEFLGKNNVPGLRIVFVEKGQLLWSMDFGYADPEKGIKVNADTVFAAASLSKPLAAVAALNLVEQGKLNLDENVNEELKGWKVPENEYTQTETVTLRRLIAHTSGFDRYYYSIYGPGETMPTIEQMLFGVAPSKDMPAKLVYQPGSSSKYSNTGYLIIEKLIEDVTGLPFEDVLDQLVLKPSGMTSSSFKQPMPQAMMDNKAIGYSENGQPYPYVAFPFKALGGLWSSPDDLAKFVATLLSDYQGIDNKILSKEMAGQVFNRGDDKLGFSLWNSGDDIVFRHTGHNSGFTSFIFGSVNKQQALVVMANGDGTQDLYDHLQRAVADAYKWDYFRSEQFEPYSGEIRQLEFYTGQYDWEGSYVSFSAEQNGLYMQIDNKRYLLTPISEHEFLLPEKPLKVVFPEDIEGKLNEVVIWKANGDYTEAIRQ